MSILKKKYNIGGREIAGEEVEFEPEREGMEHVPSARRHQIANEGGCRQRRQAR